MSKLSMQIEIDQKNDHRSPTFKHISQRWYEKKKKIYFYFNWP